MTVIEEIRHLFESRGGSQYGGECVTQLEHALQAAALAEQEGASDALIAAALLHDIGHLLHDLSEDAPERGIDDRHESRGEHWLRSRFPPEMTQPIRLHVAAKRYLCAVDPGYRAELSPPSELSLQLQGGPMSEAEVDAFTFNPYLTDAVLLRRWDDAAKDPEAETPELAAFERYLERVVLQGER